MQEPTSDVNKEYWWANKKQKVEDEGTGGSSSDFNSSYDQLRENVDQLRAFAALDPGPVLRPRRETPLTPEEQERLRERRLAEARPPADTSITSLYVGSVPPAVTAKDLMPYFLEYGSVRSISRDTLRMSAFITYYQRQDAETACRALRANFTVKGTRLRVMWARKKTATSCAPLASATNSVITSHQPPQAPKQPLLPPGVAPPPGVKVGSEYAATDPNALGTRPDVG